MCIYIYIFCCTVYLFGLRWKFHLYPEILQYYTMILQRPRITVGDARFEPRTSAPEVSGALPMTHHISRGDVHILPQRKCILSLNCYTLVFKSTRFHEDEGRICFFLEKLALTPKSMTLYCLVQLLKKKTFFSEESLSTKIFYKKKFKNKIPKIIFRNLNYKEEIKNIF